MRRIQVVDLGLDDIRTSQLLIRVVDARGHEPLGHEPVIVKIGPDRRLAVDDEVQLDRLDRQDRAEDRDERDQHEPPSAGADHRLYAQYTPIPITATPNTISAFQPQPIPSRSAAARPHRVMTNGTESRK